MYVEHLIFSIYQYSYLYATLTVFLALSYLSDKIKSPLFEDIMGNLTGLMILYLFIYLMLAMKRFYVGRWRYLLPKYFILVFLMTVTIVCLGLMVIIITYLL
jgi:hypothetical protein